MSFANIEPHNGDVWCQLGGYAIKTNPEIENFIGNNYKISPGLTIYGQVSPKNYLEFSLFNDFEKYVRLDQGYRLIEGVNRVFFSTGYRRKVFSFLNVSASLFSGYSVGDPGRYTELNAPMTTSASTVTIHGLTTGIDIQNFVSEFPLGIRLNYSKAFSEQPGEKTDQYGIFIYYQFLAQRGLTSKQREELRKLRNKKYKK